MMEVLLLLLWVLLLLLLLLLEVGSSSLAQLRVLLLAHERHLYRLRVCVSTCKCVYGSGQQQLGTAACIAPGS